MAKAESPELKKEKKLKKVCACSRIKLPAGCLLAVAAGAMSRPSCMRPMTAGRPPCIHDQRPWRRPFQDKEEKAEKKVKSEKKDKKRKAADAEEPAATPAVRPRGGGGWGGGKGGLQRCRLLGQPAGYTSLLSLLEEQLQVPQRAAAGGQVKNRRLHANRAPSGASPCLLQSDSLPHLTNARQAIGGWCCGRLVGPRSRHSTT